jgi:hypothetical protein
VHATVQQACTVDRCTVVCTVREKTMRHFVTKQTNESETTTTEPPPTFRKFLESSPPNQLKFVADASAVEHRGGRAYYELNTPDLYLHCDQAICSGLRMFRFTSGSRTFKGPKCETFFRYQCSNCKDTVKLFTLHFDFGTEAGSPETEVFPGKVYKFGEMPPFGPPTPTRLLRILGNQADLFLKGRRCETQGLGIGAFSYYRRVVEHQKNRLLDEILKVSRKLNAPQDAIDILTNAKSETQFSKALASVKNALPQALLIDGHNPMTLLHSALSEGLHMQTDAECLEIAQAVRIVLAELADRISQAVKEEAELGTAISRLMKPKS